MWGKNAQMCGFPEKHKKRKANAINTTSTSVEHQEINENLAIESNVTDSTVIVSVSSTAMVK